MKKYFSASLIIIILLLSTHAFLGLQTMRHLSPTYDEHVHLTAGYSYFKTRDYRLNSFDHPPFAEMWAAVPLLFLNPAFPTQHPYWQNILRYQYPFSDIFIYKNNVDPEKMLNSGRTMILLLSLLLGLCMYFFAKEMFGALPAYSALFLWCFSSVFLAHGSLVTTDMAVTLFYFSTIFFFWRWYKAIEQKKEAVIYPAAQKSLDSYRVKNIKDGGVSHYSSPVAHCGTGSRKAGKVFHKAVFAGLSLGLLMASKYSAIIIFPVIGLIILFYWMSGKLKIKEAANLTSIGAVSILAVLLIVYQLSSLETFYLIGLKKVIKGVSSGRSAFLLGEHSITGWFYYFPVTFILKTPLPLIALIIVSFFVRKLWTVERALFLLLPAAVYLGISCYAKVNIGHRHIMPIYPFLIVWVSGLFMFLDKKIFQAGAVLLMIWYSYGSLKAHPWHLCYFNEIVGSSDNGYKYLTDSNVDWGQGLKSLGKYLKDEKVSGIYFNYFGTGDPHYYGIKYMPFGFIDNISYPNSKGLRDGDIVDFSKEPKVFFAVSATNLQATYYADKQIFSWLKEIPYETIIAHSIFVYDMTKHPKEYAKLIGMIGR